MNLTGTGLTLDGPGASAGGTILTLTSGGLLVTGGADSIGNGLILTSGAVEIIAQVNAGASLTVNGTITGSGGMTKALTGSTTFAAPQYYTGNTTVNAGFLKLASGATNTLFANNGLVVNAGGTFDLNGGVQYVGAFTNQGAALNAGVAGGTVTSSTGPAVFVANTTTGSFSGNITGAGLTFIRSGTGNYNMLGSNSYTGATLFNGGGVTANNVLGGVTLTDNGALTGTSSITLNYTALNMSSSQGTLTDSPTRLNAAPITLNGGAITLFGRANALSSQSVGAVTLAQGLSFLSAAEQSNSGVVSTATLTLASLARTAGSGATVQFAQFYQNNSSAGLGNFNDGSGRFKNIVINNLNGVSTATGGGGLTNHLIGGWATVTPAFFITNVSEFASYIPTLGVGALNGVGFAGYDGTALVANSPNGNFRITGTALAVPAGGSSINALNIPNSTITAVSMTFSAATDVLNLTSGGLLVQNVIASAAATNIGAAPNSGILTAGGASPTGLQDLYLTYMANGAAALTINSKISDNGTSAVRFVASGGNFGTPNNITLQGTNNYTGGTIVSGETLTIGATGTLPASVTNGLTINGGTVTQSRRRRHRLARRDAERQQYLDLGRRELPDRPHDQQQRWRRRPDRDDRRGANLEWRDAARRDLEQRRHGAGDQRHARFLRQRGRAEYRAHSVHRSDHHRHDRPRAVAGDGEYRRRHPERGRPHQVAAADSCN